MRPFGPLPITVPRSTSSSRASLRVAGVARIDSGATAAATATAGAVTAAACAGAPVRDPFSGRIEGVLDISCPAEHSHPMLQTLVRSAASRIEHNLLLDRDRVPMTWWTKGHALRLLAHHCGTP